ncbi:unnamed protein product [Bursaphelenchus xylophilus]|uniref:(pine wood nematode) hypothetical protein n=1 Tax=Bursaphelenchus xylophilus TaxID=6326 RepID=A0A1I7S099_BURXY|nr:unnamed protein product [Bursaphelenchus xylophilus]CAG9108935.1 unnamed protein product [Bursaphelenchus xylophilus]
MNQPLTNEEEIITLCGLIYPYEDYLKSDIHKKVKVKGQVTTVTSAKKSSIWERVYDLLLAAHPRIANLTITQVQNQWRKYRAKVPCYIQKFHQGKEMSQLESSVLDATGFNFEIDSSYVAPEKKKRKYVSKSPGNKSKTAGDGGNEDKEINDSMKQQSHFTDDEIVAFGDVIGPYETYLTTILGEKARIKGKNFVVRAEKKKEIWGKVFNDLCQIHPRLSELGLCKIQNHWRNWRRKTSTLARKYNTGQGLSRVELAVFNAMKENIVSSNEGKPRKQSARFHSIKQEPMDEEMAPFDLYNEISSDNRSLDFLSDLSRPQRVVRPGYSLIFNRNGIQNMPIPSHEDQQDLIFTPINNMTQELTPANTPTTSTSVTSHNVQNESKLNLSEVLQIVDYCTKNNKKFEILDGALVFRDRRPDEGEEVRIPLEALGKRIPL